LNKHGSEDRQSQETGREDELSESISLLPGDVAERVFGPNPQGIACTQSSQESIRQQRQALIEARLFNHIRFPKGYDARGTEHTVCFKGQLVFKFQHSDGWTPTLGLDQKLTVASATPHQYLRRLDLQNTLFGDAIRIIGTTRANRLVTSQPTLRGGEPTENDIRDVLSDGGWQRVPIHCQNLPHQLMGSAWWHPEEELVLVDARKPNFKKTEFGTLPIDLVIGDLTEQMSDLFRAHSA